MNALLEWAQRIAKAAAPTEQTLLGPWDGSMRSRSAERVPYTHIAGGADYLWKAPGFWRRRKGQTQKFDTFGSSTGLLPAKLGVKGRQLEEFKSDSLATDGIPTLIALATKETMADTAKLDDGRFSFVYVRDQVSGANYTLGSEFSTSANYAAPGSTQQFRITPLWYSSGDGGITRGVNEFSRRFFVCGSRRFQKVGRCWYFPSLNGTPARWWGEKAIVTTAAQSVRPATTTAGAPGSWEGQDAGTQLHTYIDEATADDTDYIQQTLGAATATVTLKVGGTGGSSATDPGVDSGHVFSFRYNNPHASNTPTLTVTLSNTSGVDIKVVTIAAIPALSGWITYSVTLMAVEAALIVNYGLLSVSMTTAAASTLRISWVELLLPGVTSGVNRLIPSGPLPPVHAGTLAASTQVENTATNMRPDADVTDDSWTGQDGGTSLYSYIDETTAADSDYIRSVSDANSYTAEIGIGDPGFTPSADDVVTLRYRAVGTTGGGVPQLTVYLMQGATVKASKLTSGLALDGSTYRDFTMTLTATEIAAITDWTDLRIRFKKACPLGGTGQIRVSYATLEHTADPATLGGWRGSDKFYYSVAYRFEDDSIWMPCVPRGPNATLVNGYNLFTVDSGNLSASYQKVVWSNIPIGPYGTKSRILLRSLKIDSSTESTLQLNPTELLTVWEIKDNTTTTYDDFYADDDSLTDDPAQLLIRDDHVMPPRSRYIFAGVSRVGVSYGGLNPCAIILAPVGRAADYDLNLADDAAAGYTQNSSYFRIAIDSSGVGTFRLGISDGASLTSVDYALATYDTLEKLVDAINATSFAVNALQWRAQVLPGVNPQANCLTSLTPHTRDVASCVVSGQTITKAAGGLSKLAVGDWISGTGATLGAYVGSIDSDLQLTFVGTITAATKTLTFYKELGDAPTVATANTGYQRVIANSLPGFAFFNQTYLNLFPVEKSTAWLTVGSPLSVQSAPNCFSGKTSNRHTPPLEAGISMGGRAVDNGFVVPFANKNAAIRNERDQGSGVDSDFHLYILNESRGCCAWQSLAAGNRFATMFTPEGQIACDLYSEKLLSEDIYVRAPLATGDFTYEAPLCIAATAQDTDAAYLSAKVMRSAIWISYRSSGTRPNRQVVYDFSSGQESNGPLALVQPQDARRPGALWGWSLPLTRAVTACVEAKRDDGEHLYGWNDANAGSAGDGRIDEIEVTDQDNGVDITASILTPWLTYGSDQGFVADGFTIHHSTPAAATIGFKFHRSYSDDSYSFTLSVSSTLVVSEDRKLATLPARAVTSAGYLEFFQTAGGASELRDLEFRHQRVRLLKPTG